MPPDPPFHHARSPTLRFRACIVIGAFSAIVAQYRLVYSLDQTHLPRCDGREMPGGEEYLLREGGSDQLHQPADPRGAIAEPVPGGRDAEAGALIGKCGCRCRRRSPDHPPMQNPRIMAMVGLELPMRRRLAAPLIFSY
jgi:hypothetical protein